MRRGAFALALLLGSFLGGALCLLGLSRALDGVGHTGWRDLRVFVPAVLSLALSMPISRAPARRLELSATVYLLVSFALAAALTW